MDLNIGVGVSCEVIYLAIVPKRHEEGQICRWTTGINVRRCSNLSLWIGILVVPHWRALVMEGDCVCLPMVL